VQLLSVDEVSGWDLTQPSVQPTIRLCHIQGDQEFVA
jgi:hypothetical protein